MSFIYFKNLMQQPACIVCYSCFNSFALYSIPLRK